MEKAMKTKKRKTAKMKKEDGEDEEGNEGPHASGVDAASLSDDFNDVRHKKTHEKRKMSLKRRREPVSKKRKPSSKKQKRDERARRMRATSNSSSDEPTEALPNNRIRKRRSLSSVDREELEILPSADIPVALLNVQERPRQNHGEFAIGLPPQFDSWDEFEEELERFTTDTFQIFSKRTSTNVETRNHGTEGPIPSHWVTYAVTYRCTHGIKPVPKKNVSKMKTKPREHRYCRYTGCSAVINATVKHMYKGKDGWVIKVKARGGHNHDVSPELFRYYPEVRLKKTPQMMADVDRLVRAGVQAHGVLATLREETQKPVQRKDVYNLIAKVKLMRVAGTTVEERLQTSLESFVDEMGNWARLFADAVSKEARTVAWQPGRMRRWFAACPEVMMVDCTHFTNRSKYLLFSFVIHDIFGKGQFVKHALLHRETMDSMEDAIAAFVEHNPRSSEVRALIVDKDFKERTVLRKYFKAARILLCHYHVIKVFAKKVKQLVRRTDAEKVQIVGVLRAMVYAKSKAAYDALKLLFASELSSLVKPDEIEYDEARDGDNDLSLSDEDEEDLPEDVLELDKTASEQSEKARSIWSRCVL